MAKVIFYSWQSDTTGNKTFLNALLERFVQENSDYTLESAERDPQGADDISHVILDKISNCDYIVSDVTIINPEDKDIASKRLTSNPNVLYELGYATGLGKRRVIIANEKFVAASKDLPFDIRNRRMILKKFDKKNVERIYRELAYALKMEDRVDASSVDEVVHDIIQAKIRIHNPEVAMEVSGHDLMVRELGYHLEFLPNKLPMIKRTFDKYPRVYELVEEYLERMVSFSKLYATLGPESHHERLESLRKVNSSLDELITVLVDEKLVIKKDLSQAREDYLETLNTWLKRIDNESNLDLQAFYKYCDGVELYYNLKLYTGTEDNKLYEILVQLQKLRGKYTLDHDIQTVKEEIRRIQAADE